MNAVAGCIASFLKSDYGTTEFDPDVDILLQVFSNLVRAAIELKSIRNGIRIWKN